MKIFSTPFRIICGSRPLRVIRCPLLLILSAIFVVSCEREIGFDYPTSEAKIVFNGEISNEGVFVRISRTRPMSDSTKNHFIRTAQVWISSDDGTEEQLYYDENQQRYLSSTGLVGIPGHTYTMRALVDEHTYEASSTMQPPAPVDTVFFRWIDALNERIYFVCVRGHDPRPNERNYYLCRLMRGNELFRWNPRSGRSSIDGIFEYDVVCSSESEIDKGIDEYGGIPLMDGDTIRTELITIDRACWDFYQSLMISERTTANAITNVRGGALGIFMAANITRPDTLVFKREND